MREFQEMVVEAAEAQRAAQFSMDTEFMMPFHIDEISLLFDSQDSLAEFAAWAETAGGMDHFNRVDSDTAVRIDNMTIPSEDRQEFKHRFEFLRIPGADWRIEAMCVLEGVAPIHEAHVAKHGNGCVVHASWKLPDRQSYEATWARHEGLRLFAEYRNSYGIFSYWHASGTFYFKPRVNLRDN